jgi:hypothetical protein
MNRLLIVLGILGTAAVICVTSRLAEQKIQSGSATLTSQLTDAETTLSQSQAGLDSTRAQLVSLEHDLADARASLEQAETEARTAKPPELDPAREGAWPATQPYFYLAKRRLKDIGFSLFSNEDRLTKATLALFSLSAEEQAALDAATSQYRNGLNNLDLQNVERTEAAPGVNSATHHEITFKLHLLTDGVPALREQFQIAVTAALGPQRSEYFLDQAEWWLFAQTERDAEITLAIQADSNWHLPDGRLNYKFQLHTPTSSMSSGEFIPQRPGSSLWSYRHLIGDQLWVNPPPSPEGERK